jgi:dTMP kinase
MIDMNRGIYIALEGCEGSGKSTAARLLIKRLLDEGYDVQGTREPGGTELGEEIRALLLHGLEISPRTELFLMLAARTAVMHEVVLPGLTAGLIVVGDRNYLSTLAYQGYGRGLPLDEIRMLNRAATEGVLPDVILLIDVADETRARRIGRRELDRIERAGDAFHERVRAAYDQLAQSEPNVVRVDGNGRPEIVAEACFQVLLPFLRGVGCAEDRRSA